QRADPGRRLRPVPAAADQLRRAVRRRPAPAPGPGAGRVAVRPGRRPGQQRDRRQRLTHGDPGRRGRGPRCRFLGHRACGADRPSRLPNTPWGRDAAVAAAIAQRHENPRYLPGIPLPDSLRATTDLAAAVRGADLLLVVVPSHAFTETLRALAPLRSPHAGVAWAAKGFEPGSGRF